MTTNNEAFEKWRKFMCIKPLNPQEESNLIWAKSAMIYGIKSATTEANKRIAELEREVAEMKAEFSIVSNHLVRRFGEEKKKSNELKASNNYLRDALENVLPWVVYQPVACHGMKCRESVCESCCGEEAAEIASKQAGEAVTIARKTLSTTPAESLQAFKNELIERCANVCDEDAQESRLFGESFQSNVATLLAEAIRALKEVK